MQTPEVISEQQIAVRLTAGTTLLPLTTLSFLKLPNILKMEIENPIFRESGKQVEVLNKIITMLGVQFSSMQDRKTAGSEWIAFCQKYPLTAPEIVEAYTLTLRKELTLNGAEIKIFPNLSLITAGEILKSYEEYKKQNLLYQKGKEDLKQAISEQQKVENNPQKAKQNRQNLYHLLLKETQAGKICRHGFMFYEEFYQNEDFPGKQKTAAEKWEQVYEKIKQRIAYEKSNKLSVFSAQDLKMIESITQQGFNAFFVQRNSPTLTKIKALVKTEIQNESVFNYLKSKQYETNPTREKSPNGGLQE